MDKYPMIVSLKNNNSLFDRSFTNQTTIDSPTIILEKSKTDTSPDGPSITFNTGINNFDISKGIISTINGAIYLGFSKNK
jgi:hypothetical protein